MADQNPTGGPRIVPIDLPPAQTEILRGELLRWLAGIEGDLGSDQLPYPGADAREADAFRRLLTALDRGEVALPDDEARESMSRAAEGYDDASGYERIVAFIYVRTGLRTPRFLHRVGETIVDRGMTVAVV